jgi:LuxR family transcriptional regulator, maltose regulon positive regulatory protein
MAADPIRGGTLEQPELTRVGPAGRPSASLLVRRPRLLDALTIDPAAVSLVCAPAGSGKTALLRHLVTAPGSVPTAYVDLGRHDGTPAGVWSALLGALRSLDVVGSNSAIGALEPPDGTVSRAFVDLVLGAISAIGRPVRLVLDDLHTIADPDTLASLDLLIARQPDELLLVLATRHDPPLALHHPRLAGQLYEIREDDLAFREDELIELLERAGCTLDTFAVQLLHRHTEGWAAGIRFAVLSLHDGADPEELLADFGGHDQAIADYLMAEVLTQQTDEMRTFLLVTSACATLPVELAELVSGRRDAGDVLDGLVRRHALTERLDARRGVYRYHPVLRTYLDAERRRRRPEAEVELQRTVGSWYAARGDWLSALEHLLHADDPQLLLTLLRERAIAVMLDGQLDRLERVFEQLPASLQQEPSVTLLHALFAPALAHATVRRVPGVELDAAAHSDDHLLRTLAALVQAQQVPSDDALAGSLRDLADLAAAPTGNQELDLLVRHHLSVGLLGSGRLAEGNSHLAEVARAARTSGRDALAVSALGQLATAALLGEDLRRAEDLALEATAIAARRGWAQMAHVLPARLTLLWIGFQRGDRDEAARHLALARGALGSDLDPRLRRSVETCELIVAIDGEGASYPLLRDHLALTRSAPLEMPPHYHANVGPLLVWAALQLGERTWALELARDHGDPLPASGEQQLMRAMLLHAAGHESATAKSIAQVIDGALEVVSRATLIHAHLLATHLALRRGTTARAHESLLAALRIADDTGLVRPFLHSSPEVHQQLIASADRCGHLAPLARRLVELANDQPAARAPQTLLTPAETSILRDLPSLLTIRDIAVSRSISTNTVKTHLSAIYRKLGVRGRREAVELARRRGLL